MTILKYKTRLLLEYWEHIFLAKNNNIWIIYRLCFLSLSFKMLSFYKKKKKNKEFVFMLVWFLLTVLIELFVVSPFSCLFLCIVILSGPAGYYLDHWQRLGQKKCCFWLYSIKAEAIHKLHQHDMKCVRWHSKCLKPPGFWLDIYTSTKL